ncbi:UDP-N-acetylmuramoyl-tripeptide--D-alanyl-D-alanine ligase [Propionicimonas paludicola]|uniref:UDP-N-acetylmuramoyl-tripeptide--D-alanyl-D-alanine ligase n=1 Tax=Propionicimonas paludicola TaxID=185243 RepID=A0A2A9CRD6_9ACTN|nr:UDP-N-acetylmuramoyl-tripeptide--D-alanyl-D-alanine ligase [Propionicimonas paludicola]PFG16973.1 UDP-N-acetylmuramoyl-tripeptide--D-alanyl-D-alanine ligase [Propionicimonas paludicola]
MHEMTTAQLAALVDARLIGDPTVTVGPTVVIDSRLARPGSVFVALPGERVDGHDFAAAAVAGGAAAVLVGRELDLPVPQLLVADPAEGLARLARGLVDEAIAGGLVSVAVTGSSGKTSTKDLIAQVLAVAGETVAPVGSQNNEIGVPLTATRVDTGTRYLVSEFGARGLGHIRWLCQVVPPRIGVVLNVGQAHLGEFGSQAVIAQAKGELVKALLADGWAVLNAADPLVAAMAGRTAARLASFGAADGPGELRVWADSVELDELSRAGFDLHAAGLAEGVARVSLQVSGAHQVENALAAAAVGLLAGIDLAEVADALSRAEARSRWRMELTQRPDRVLVVNDAYNANPDSMAAALHSLAGLRRPAGRLLAILGDMLELGDTAAECHRRVGALAAELGIDHLIVIGDHAEDLAAGARVGGVGVSMAPDRTAALATAADWLRPDDAVLVKASRGLALETVAQALAEGRSTLEVRE